MAISGMLTARLFPHISLTGGSLLLRQHPLRPARAVLHALCPTPPLLALRLLLSLLHDFYHPLRRTRGRRLGRGRNRHPAALSVLPDAVHLRLEPEHGQLGPARRRARHLRVRRRRGPAQPRAAGVHGPEPGPGVRVWRGGERVFGGGGGGGPGRRGGVETHGGREGAGVGGAEYAGCDEDEFCVVVGWESVRHDRNSEGLRGSARVITLGK